MFGSDPVDVSVDEPGTVLDDWNIPDDDVNWAPLSGCRFRPLSVREAIALSEKVGETWKLTSPPHAALLAATSSSLIRHRGRIYEIDGGIMPFTDSSGSNYKVTVMCKRQQVETS